MSNLPFASLLLSPSVQMASSTVPNVALRADFEEAYDEAFALKEQLFEVTEPDALVKVANFFLMSLVFDFS
jgi:hypothetical protein